MIIEAKEGRFDKIHIHIDGEYLTTIDSAYWYSSGYVSGDEITQGELAAFRDAADSRRAFNAGADIISRREHSQKELFSKLCKKYSPEVAQGAVERLCELGMVSDERFAEMYTQELYFKKGMGKRRILFELSLKGIDKALASDTVEKIISQDDEDIVQRIVDIISKKYYNIENDEKQRRRAWNALQRLGYSPSDIKRAFSQFSEYDFDSSEGW